MLHPHPEQVVSALTSSIRYGYFSLPLQGEPGYASTTTHVIAMANGVFSAGGAVGSLLVMWSCDAFGRKRNIQLGAFLSLLGGALQGVWFILDLLIVMLGY